MIKPSQLWQQMEVDLAVANALLNEAVPNSISGIVPKNQLTKLGNWYQMLLKTLLSNLAQHQYQLMLVEQNSLAS